MDASTRQEIGWGESIQSLNKLFCVQLDNKTFNSSNNGCGPSLERNTSPALLSYWKFLFESRRRKTPFERNFSVWKGPYTDERSELTPTELDAVVLEQLCLIDLAVTTGIHLLHDGLQHARRPVS